MNIFEWRRLLSDQTPITECIVPYKVQCEIWKRTRPDIGEFFRNIQIWLRKRGFNFPGPTGDGKPSKTLHYSFLDKDRNLVNRIIKRPKSDTSEYDEAA